MSENNEKNIYEKLGEQIEKAHWKLLEEHHTRGALINVDQALDLVRVGVDVAEDNVESIRQLMTSGQVGRPTDEQVANWNDDEELHFNFIILQPYVLCQKIKEEE